MNIDIVVGSVLGASEYVAEAIDQTLTNHGHNTKCHFKPSINNINLENFLVVVTSTHGAGDLPDNIQQFAADLSTQNLPTLHAIVIGLGDSSYDTFCEGSRKIEAAILQAGGQLLLPVFQIDVLHHPIPEDIAVQWLKNNINALNL